MCSLWFPCSTSGFGPGHQWGHWSIQTCIVSTWLGGGNSNMLYFHLDSWGNDPIWRAYFSNGLVQAPTSLARFSPTLGQQWELQSRPLGGSLCVFPGNEFDLLGWGVVSSSKSFFFATLWLKIFSLNTARAFWRYICPLIWTREKKAILWGWHKKISKQQQTNRPFASV